MALVVKPTLGISGLARGLPVAVGLCSQMVGSSLRNQSVVGVVMGLVLLGARLGLQHVDASPLSGAAVGVVPECIALSPECSLPLACISPQLSVLQFLFAVPHCAAPSPVLVTAVPLHFSSVNHARFHKLILS